jgi:hypothetical protein
MHLQVENVENREKKPHVMKKPIIRHSFWVIVGFMLWLGFFIGAVIMHAMNQ